MSVRPTVYLHIGTPKSGTSYLQRILRRNRVLLREGGVLYPTASHFHAALDLRRLRMAGYDDPRTAGAWRRLVAEIDGGHPTVVVSHELFAGTRADFVDQALHDLSFADVHIVLTMRTMDRTLPAAWQERVKLGGTETFAEFVSAVRQAPPAGGSGWTDASHKFWNLQNVPAVLQKWSRGLDPDRVHVVSVPPASDDLATGLWARFAGVIGVDPQGTGHGAGFVVPREPANRSMGAVETTVLRRFNETLGNGYPWDVYSPLVKDYLAGHLGVRPGPVIELAQGDLAWARDWSARTARTIDTRGYHVVGACDDALDTPPATGTDPDTVSVEQQLAVALDGMATMAKYVAADSRSHDALTLPVLRSQLRRARRLLLPELRRAVSETPTRELVRRFAQRVRPQRRTTPR